MIDFGKIQIDTIADYDQLLGLIDNTHIDAEVITDLKKYIGTKCKV